MNFPFEVAERAVRMVLEHQGGDDLQQMVICSIAAKISCTAEILRHQVSEHARDSAQPECATSARHQRIKTLEREIKEL